VPGLRLPASSTAVAAQPLDPPDETVPIGCASNPATVTVPWPQIKPDSLSTSIPTVGKLLLTLGTLANRIEVEICAAVAVGVGDGETPATGVVVTAAVAVVFAVAETFGLVPMFVVDAGEAAAIDVVVFTVAFAETFGLVPVFVDELVQPAIDSEATIISATIAATFLNIRTSLQSQNLITLEEANNA